METKSKMHFLVLLGLVFLLPASSIATESLDVFSPSFNFTFNLEEDAVYMLDNEMRYLNLTILQSDPGILRIESSDRGVFVIVNQSIFTIPENTVFPLTFELIVKGKFLGVEEMEFYLQDDQDTTEFVGTFAVKIGLSRRALNDVFTYVLLAWLCISYITMGTKMELKVIWTKLRRPWAVLIGMLCQFFIMPALAFGLAKLFILDDETAVGLILDGTCPGGWFSNIFSILLDCDVVLSLTMTFMSTFLALGMMPLNLFIYATSYTEGNDALQTPFVELAIQMLLLLIPVGIGMVITWKFAKLRKWFDIIMKPTAGILLLLALIIGLPSSVHVFLSPWQIWIASAMFPLTGATLGFIFAKIACIENRSAVTVALETGAQNSLMARTMIDLFYPLPEADLVGRVPTLISLLTMFEGIIILFCYEFWKRCLRKKADDEKALTEDEKDMDITKLEKVNGKNGHAHGLAVNGIDVEIKRSDPEQGVEADPNGNEKHLI